MDTDVEKTYTYDKRDNLSQITANGQIKNQYLYGALNRLEQAVNGKGEAASYQYNGLGHRVGKVIGKKSFQIMNELNPVKTLQSQTINPEKQLRYMIDLTREYYNLLQKEEEGRVQAFLWDGNVAGMLEDGKDSASYYLQDDLGSPIRLARETGHLSDSYGYDEFGQDLYGNQGIVQPFGFTGYQRDNIAGTYFAQAREYAQWLGRFVAKDRAKGYIKSPQTINQYIYCWNNPINFVDNDGLEPITAADGIEAHMLLEKELEFIPGVETEKVIPGAGRADVVYNNGGIYEIYEIKPGSYTPGAINNIEGILQLQGYVDGMVRNGYMAVEGYSLNPVVSATTIPSVLHPDKMIKYYVYPSNQGMIYWSYINMPIREPQPSVEYSRKKEEAFETTKKLAGGALVIFAIYEVVKWGAAALAAVPAGGTSLLGAGCIP